MFALAVLLAPGEAVAAGVVLLICGASVLKNSRAKAVRRTASAWSASDDVDDDRHQITASGSACCPGRPGREEAESAAEAETGAWPTGDGREGSRHPDPAR